MKETSVATAVGIFVIIGLVCMAYLTIKLGKMEWPGEQDYPVFARFESVSGLKTGASIEMAGVRIGRVEAISLDKDSLMAVVKLHIRKDVALEDDVIASVTTAGLIGDKYISISPGGSGDMLKPGDTITETESAVSLEGLIRKYVFGGVEQPTLE